MEASMIGCSAVIFKGARRIVRRSVHAWIQSLRSAARSGSRDLASLIHPQHDPAVQRAGRGWVRGDGAMLTDADGKEYIDGLAGLWNVVLGHSRRELADAARASRWKGWATRPATPAARILELSSWPSGLAS
jgi:4-aminobutyrate aminotransferase-like enzyme